MLYLHYMKQMVKSLFVSLLVLMLPALLRAQSSEVIRLWPNGAPTQNGASGPEIPNDRMTNYKNISDPTLEVFPAEHPNGTCIIVCPGGAYWVVSVEYEGRKMAPWMNEMGVTLAVLKYRLPLKEHHEVPLDDAQRAISIIRSNAAKWGIDPHKVGIMGASAGGHLAASASTLYGSLELRPDFSVLLYPVITMQAEHTHMGSRVNLIGETPSEYLIGRYDTCANVTEDTPPAFIVFCSDDDVVPPYNSLQYYQALLDHGVKNCAMVSYPTGGHGWGIDTKFKYHGDWKRELELWLREVIFN